MGIKTGTKRVFKSMFNVSAWMDSQRLSESSSAIGRSLKSITVPKTSNSIETFEEAVERLEMSEQDIQDRKNEFKRIANVIFLVTIGIIGYSIYLMVEGHLMGGIVALAISTVAFAQGFKFHFWYFQLEKRKFGCTFTEWLKEGFLS